METALRIAGDLVSYLWLGATHSSPAVELALAPEGERLPLSLGIDNAYAFDDGLPRMGWVAVHVGYQVVALTDGDLLSRVLLPEAWHVLPAADPELVLLRRYFGRSSYDGEPSTVELCDAAGRVLRRTQVSGGVVGELRPGWLVTPDAIVSWDGEREPLPARGTAIAVLDGRHLVLDEGNDLRLVDTETGAATVFQVRCGSTLSRVYDATGTSLAFKQYGGPDIFVVTQTAPPRWHRVPVRQHSAVWSDPDHLVIAGERGARVVDVQTGELTDVPGVPRGAHPRIDVTGRFDPEQLRAVLRPPWRGPVPASAREEILARSRELVHVAAAAAGLPERALKDARPAIRLRSCLAPRNIPVGASRLGGRPDLPRRMSWPTFEDAPMAFLTQLRLDELVAALPERRLPIGGVLVVFVAIEPDGGFPVRPDALHVEVVAGDGLTRRAWPRALPAELRYDAALAVAEPMLSVPDWPHLEGVLTKDALERFRAAVQPRGPMHQLFGHPSTIQGYGPPAHHELLLQFDGDPLVGAEFGDGGRLHVWVPDGTSLSGRIEGCLVDMDCH